MFYCFMNLTDDSNQQSTCRRDTYKTDLRAPLFCQVVRKENPTSQGAQLNFLGLADMCITHTSLKF